MKYLASLVLLLSLNSAAFADDTKSPISDTQAKNLIKADTKLHKAQKHKHAKAVAKVKAKAPEAAPAATETK